jgi:hypothetical protein
MSLNRRDLGLLPLGASDRRKIGFQAKACYLWQLGMRSVRPTSVILVPERRRRAATESECLRPTQQEILAAR